jgi:acyl-CoA thioesterase YciA
MSDKPRGELTTRTIAMPADSNPAGDIFGGWVLSQMDIAAGICASERAQCRVVTVALDGMHFIRPVKIGDILCVYTEVKRVGNTSLEIHVEAWVQRDRSRNTVKVTQANFTFVALDGDGRPRKVRSPEDND